MKMIFTQNINEADTINQTQRNKLHKQPFINLLQQNTIKQLMAST